MKKMNNLELLKKRKIYLYGIGKLGKKIYDQLEFMGVDVHKIMVSDKKNLPEKYHGVSLEKYEVNHICGDALVILAIPESVSKSVERDLKARGIDCLLWNKKIFEGLWLEVEHGFIDRRQYGKKVLFILAGYKEFLWKNVFERVKKYKPGDIEVCILSSGIYDEKLAEIASENKWSYLYTKLNSVTLIQNIAYSKYDYCEWIYKMDEDIFLTQNSLYRLYDSYRRFEQNEPYHVGVVAPLIPLNEHCCRYILEKYDCIDDFENRYGKLYYGGDGMIINNIDIAPYMWGKYQSLPSIDAMNVDCMTDLSYSLCATRYNIGLILFHRSLWEEMHGFTVTGGADMGADEEELCSWCVKMSRPIMVTHNTIVGHFSFGPQENNMLKYISRENNT